MSVRLEILSQRDGTKVVDAEETPTSGLFLYPTNGGPGWTLGHHSGAAVGFFETRGQAYGAAIDLAGIVDWTVAGEAFFGIDLTAARDVLWLHRAESVDARPATRAQLRRDFAHVTALPIGGTR